MEGKEGDDKKFKENCPEISMPMTITNTQPQDQRGIEDSAPFLPGDVGGREERWVNLSYLFGQGVSSLYIVSTLSICIYLLPFSHYFFLASWSHVTLQPQCGNDTLP